MKDKSNPICLLGATGFLGSAIAKELDERKIDWIGTSLEESKDLRIKRIDLTDTEALVNIFQKSSVVINALGSAKPEDYEGNPSETLNNLWQNIISLSESLKLGKVAKLIHISSAGAVYGEQKDVRHTEKSAVNPISWYGKAKVIEELFLEKHCQINDSDYLCLRVSNPYGNKNKTTHGFIDVLINAVLSGNKFSFYEDCNPVRDFIYAEDMAFSIVELIQINATGVFNLGSGKSHSLKSISDYVIKKMDGKHLISRHSNKPDYDVLKNEICVEKLSTCRAKRSSMDIFTYIDKKLDKNIP
jgi:UDP-glucose 4-epimerase